jgi:hypothetical protein
MFLAIEVDEGRAVTDDDVMECEAGAGEAAAEAAEQARQAEVADRQDQDQQQQQQAGVDALDGFAQAWARVQAAAVAVAGGGSSSIGSRDPSTPQAGCSELAGFSGPGPDGSAAAAWFASLNQQQLQHYHSAPGQLGDGSEDGAAAAGDAFYGGSSSYPGAPFQQQQQQQYEYFNEEGGAGRSMSGAGYAGADMGDSGSRSASPTKAGGMAVLAPVLLCSKAAQLDYKMAFCCCCMHFTGCSMAYIANPSFSQQEVSRPQPACPPAASAAAFVAAAGRSGYRRPDPAVDEDYTDKPAKSKGRSISRFGAEHKQQRAEQVRSSD